MGHTATTSLTAPSDILASTAITNQLVTLHSIRCMPWDFTYPYFHTSELCVLDSLFLFSPNPSQAITRAAASNNIAIRQTLRKRNCNSNSLHLPVCLSQYQLTDYECLSQRRQGAKSPYSKKKGGFVGYTKFTPEKSFSFF